MEYKNIGADEQFKNINQMEADQRKTNKSSKVQSEG